MLKLFSKDTRYLNYIICGLYVFYISLMLDRYLFLDKLLTRPISLLGIVMASWGFLKIRKSLRGVDSGIIFVYNTFILVCIVNVIIGIPLEVQSGNKIGWFFDTQTMWMFLIGLTFFIPISFQSITTVVSWALLYAITALIFSLYNFGDFYIHPTDIISNSIVGQFDGYRYNRPQEPGLLLVPMGAFLCFFSNLSVKWRFLIVITFVLAVLAALFQGRRAVALVTICYPVIAFLVYALEKGSRVVKYSMIIIFLVFILSQIVSFEEFVHFSSDNFVVLTERIDQNTREAVHEDFYKDMKEPADWIIGRGMAGTYRSLQLSAIDRINRTLVETGYLNMILHGGLILLIPYICLLLYTFYVGFFHSKNYFVKACALYVLFHLFLLFPGGHLRLTFECFILFAFMRICMSQSWRILSNEIVEDKICKFLPSL